MTRTITMVMATTTDHAHDGQHDNHDLNMRAAHMHVLADALTSVLAITALNLGY